MNLLECQDPNKYRKKIKGFHMAFNTKERDLRISKRDLSKYKYKGK